MKNKKKKATLFNALITSGEEQQRIIEELNKKTMSIRLMNDLLSGQLVTAGKSKG